MLPDLLWTSTVAQFNQCLGYTRQISLPQCTFSVSHSVLPVKVSVSCSINLQKWHASVPTMYTATTWSTSVWANSMTNSAQCEQTQFLLNWNGHVAVNSPLQSAHAFVLQAQLCSYTRLKRKKITLTHWIHLPWIKLSQIPQRHADEYSDVHFPTPTGCLFSWLVSTSYQDAMALFWPVSHVMTSTEGTNGKQYHECPLVILIGFQWLPIWSPKAGTTSLPPNHIWDHLHLYFDPPPLTSSAPLFELQASPATRWRKTGAPGIYHKKTSHTQR